MTPWQTVVAHATVAVVGIAAICVLAVKGVIPGSDAFTVIVAVLTASGVIAGNSLSNGSSTTTVAPPPAPQARTTAAGQK